MFLCHPASNTIPSLPVVFTFSFRPQLTLKRFIVWGWLVEWNSHGTFKVKKRKCWIKSISVWCVHSFSWTSVKFNRLNPNESLTDRPKETVFYTESTVKFNFTWQGGRMAQMDFLKTIYLAGNIVCRSPLELCSFSTINSISQHLKRFTIHIEYIKAPLPLFMRGSKGLWCPAGISIVFL